MIVVDASVLANALGDHGQDGRIARDELRTVGEFAAPDLVNVETVAVLRKRWLRGDLSAEDFESAVLNLQRLNFERVPTLRLLHRAHELRFNVTAYDATYVALAEALNCELLTGDRRLAAAFGPLCAIRVLG